MSKQQDMLDQLFGGAQLKNTAATTESTLRDIARGEELKKELLIADMEYYAFSNSSIGDKEYDRKYEEYVNLEKMYPELKTLDSPTQRIGSNVLSKLEKFTHKTPLLSINQKKKTEGAIRKYYEECKKEADKLGIELKFIIQPKFDGLTVNVNYEKLKNQLMNSLFNTMLANAASRGNGFIGDLITENIKTVKSVPLGIPHDGELEVRGEAIVHYNKWLEDFSEEYKNPRNMAAGLTRLLDSKEVASKKCLDVVFYDIGKCDKEFTDDEERLNFLKEQGFKITPYKVVDNADDLVRCCLNYFDGNIKVKDGFNVLDNKELSFNDVLCDGLVIKVSNLKLREAIGETAKGPKWTFAYKFKSLRVKTTLRDVVWSTGKSGKLTPKAVVDAVNIGGTTVKSATLNNEDFIKNLYPAPIDYITGYFIKNDGLYVVINEEKEFKVSKITREYTEETKELKVGKETIIVPKHEAYILETEKYILKEDTEEDDDKNIFVVRYSPEFNMLPNIVNILRDEEYFHLHIEDTLILERSNDVIPKIIGIDPSSRIGGYKGKEVLPPEKCPVCGEIAEVIYPQRFCRNINCSARLKELVEHFASRDAMNIVSLGEAIADTFVDMGYINKLTDIYSLKEYREEIIALDKWGEKKAENLFKAIEESKDREFYRFILAIGIGDVGIVTAKDLANHFKNIDALMNASIDDLKAIENIGETTALSIWNFFNIDRNKEVIEEFKNIGINMVDNSEPKGEKFLGKTFVITGTLANSRDYYKKIIEDNGGKVSSSVSKNTYAVLIGTDAGSKESKAEELVSNGAKIILLKGDAEVNAFLEL